MSYWISLYEKKPDENGEGGKIATVDRFQEGGTQPVGGTNEAEINVTYNYSKHFDYRSLHNLRAEDTILKLKKAVQELSTIRDVDYWADTPGNAGYACSILLAWAKANPDAWWNVN